MFNEEEVVNNILNGNLQAFKSLVKQHERLVFHVVNRLISVEEDTEDICQEVFIKIHRNLHMFNFKAKLSTWIARIAYLTAINHLKKYQKQNLQNYPDNLDNYYFTNDDPQQLMIKKDVAAYVNYLMSQMPEQYRILLTLYHLEEFSYQEIEDITGMPEGTVKNYLFRARKMLKGKLEAYLKNE